jgi:hypothetical protein
METPAVAAEPIEAVAADASLPEEAAPVDAEAADGTAETSAETPAETSAEKPVEGANWAFRGRIRPRERKPGGFAGAPRPGGKGARDGEGGPKRGGGRKAGPKGEGRGDDARRERDRGGKDRGGKAPGRFAHRDPERPAGGGAFAGLAALLGREE